MSKSICYCSVCGVSSEVKGVHRNKEYGDYLCEKHKQQYKKFGKFLDNSPRGIFDENEIRLRDAYAEIDTYNSRGEIVATYLLDLEDVPKLKGHKWRTVFKNDKPYLFTGNQLSERIYFHRLVMNASENQIDHISGNTLDNRKDNLREVSIKENMMNLQKKSSNTSGVRGVSFDKRRNNWKVDFTVNKQRIYLKAMSSKEEAIYLRYLCEITFLKEYRNTANDNVIFESINKLSNDAKKSLEIYFNERINTTKVGV